ncbi:MAG TPA: hydroxymethylbilane synthase [Chitinophagaceae bacterium]|nr:hydroxymethylbilane synthase [Chitinophagaceae bacterium]
MSGKHIRIGTRESPLAKAQAHIAATGLEQAGYTSEMILVKSGGDIDLHTPLYEMGVQGIFTRELDVALLKGEIDIAVHSLKDIPVQPAMGIVIAAVLERESPLDVLVWKDEMAANKLPSGAELRIATSSIRRTAQWKHRFPATSFEDIRGNVGTRLKKLHTSEIDGAVFAAAGLRRLGLTANETGPQTMLDWMLPAPGQGAIAVCCRAEDAPMAAACSLLNHEETSMCTRVEREFLRLLHGGCTSPVAALAVITNDQLRFEGNIVSPDGKQKVSTLFTVNSRQFGEVAGIAADQVMRQGGLKLLKR